MEIAKNTQNLRGPSADHPRAWALNKQWGASGRRVEVGASRTTPERPRTITPGDLGHAVLDEKAARQRWRWWSLAAPTPAALLQEVIYPGNKLARFAT